MKFIPKKKKQSSNESNEACSGLAIEFRIVEPNERPLL